MQSVPVFKGEFVLITKTLRKSELLCPPALSKALVPGSLILCHLVIYCERSNIMWTFFYCYCLNGQIYRKRHLLLVQREPRLLSVARSPWHHNKNCSWPHNIEFRTVYEDLTYEMKIVTWFAPYNTCHRQYWMKNLRHIRRSQRLKQSLCSSLEFWLDNIHYCLMSTCNYRIGYLPFQICSMLPILLLLWQCHKDLFMNLLVVAFASKTM